MGKTHPERLRRAALGLVNAGYPMGEVCKRLGLPESTIRTWLGREKMVKLEHKVIELETRCDLLMERD